jgi:hypothetical protein
VLGVDFLTLTAVCMCLGLISLSYSFPLLACTHTGGSALLNVEQYQSAHRTEAKINRSKLCGIIFVVGDSDKVGPIIFGAVYTKISMNLWPPCAYFGSGTRADTRPSGFSAPQCALGTPLAFERVPHPHMQLALWPQPCRDTLFDKELVICIFNHGYPQKLGGDAVFN